MKYSNNALNILACLTYKGIGKAWVVKSLVGGEPEELVVSILNQSLKIGSTSLSEFEARKDRIASSIEQKAGYMDGLVALGDAEFPKHRGVVKNSEKPVALFYKGDISLLSVIHPSFAVIGVLEPDQSTVAFERDLIQLLTSKEVNTVSGLANGCDAVAHEQTILSGGKTIAVLPSPLHNIIPASNRGLALKIVKSGGLLVTEYLNDATSKMAFTGRYQERDRLQVLFSDAIILASSYAKNDLGNDSGSRLAMQYAGQYQIPRAVMYDEDRDALNPKFDLNRQLIKEDSSIVIFRLGSAMEAIDSLLSKKQEFVSLPEVQASLFV